MAKYCGSLYLIEVEDTAGSDTWTAISTIRENSLNQVNEQVDTTDKGAMPFRELFNCGVHSKSLSGSGLFSDNSALEIVHARVIDGDLWNYRVTSDKGDKYQGAFQVASFDRNGPYNTAEEFSISLESSGEIVYTPAP